MPVWTSIINWATVSKETNAPAAVALVTARSTNVGRDISFWGAQAQLQALRSPKLNYNNLNQKASLSWVWCSIPSVEFLNCRSSESSTSTYMRNASRCEYSYFSSHQVAISRIGTPVVSTSSTLQSTGLHTALHIRDIQCKDYLLWLTTSSLYQ